MHQLEGAKCSFLLCLGISIVICSAIYLRARVRVEPQPLTAPVGCRPFDAKCAPFLSSLEEGMEWHRRDCQVESYISNPGLNCSHLARDLHFISRPLSEEEERYPLAFILTIHKELEVFVRLLRAVYAPQNVYCVHVDAKAPRGYRAAVARLAGCLPNVFLAGRSETVAYAGFSRLQADINCMRDLVVHPVAWRKVVNMCGQDFPVKSNLELVRYLGSKEWRDRNMTPGVRQPAEMGYRTELQHREVAGSHVAPRGRGGRRFRKGPAPAGLEVYFGTAYYALTRGFVDFVLTSPMARDLLEWSRDTYSPDEHYFVMLNHVREAPGSHIDGGWNGDIRSIKWRDQEGTAHQGCKGRYVRDICIYGVDDLPWIIDKNSMFANKFESGSFPEALDCLEQWHRDKQLRQAAVPIEPSWRLAIQVHSNSNSSGSSSYYNNSSSSAGG